MNRSRKTLKKTAVTLLSASLVLSGGSTVFAAGSYKETEKTALKNLTEALPGTWDEYLENYNKSISGTKSNITLRVEDTGRALLGVLMGGADVSWLKDVSIDSNISINDGVEAIVSSLLINGNQICDFNIFMDLANMMQYIQIPEISEAYVIAPISTDTDENNSEESQAAIMATLSDLTKMLPDSKTMTTLLDRYGNIIIDSFEEGSSVEETISVDGISESSTVYEGLLSDKSANEMLDNILTTAKDDSEIKALFDKWSEGSDNGEEQYKEFQKMIENSLNNKDNEENITTGIVSSKIWVNENGKIIGREIGVIENNETSPLFTWKAPSEGNNSALSLAFTAEDESFTLTGSGTALDGLLNGDYTIAIDGVDSVNINVKDLETKPEKSGYYNGTFNVSFPSDTGESSSEEGSEAEANPLAGFGAVVKLISDASAETSSLELTITSSGASLATLSLTGGYGEGVEIPDLKSIDKSYNATSDEDMTGYLDEINWDTLIANVKAAGVPDELASQLESILVSAIESASEPELIEDEIDPESSTSTNEDNAA